MLNMIIALLLEKELLSEYEAEELVENLKYATMPGDFPSARAAMKKIMAKIERGRIKS